MIIDPYRLAVPVSYSTWDPANKGANISLSGGDLIASSTTSDPESVLGTQGRVVGSGSYQFEITAGGDDRQLVGLGDTAADLNNYPGSDSFAFTYYAFNGNLYSNGPNLGFTNDTWTAGDVIGVVMWIDGTVNFYKNGTLQTYAWSVSSGTYYPIWGPGGVAGSRSATLNVGPTFAYPVGVSVWG